VNFTPVHYKLLKRKPLVQVQTYRRLLGSSLTICHLMTNIVFTDLVGFVLVRPKNSTNWFQIYYLTLSINY
jgi:hypothetical protein